MSTRIELPAKDWQPGLVEQLRAAPERALIVVRTEYQHGVVHVIAKRIGRKDLSCVVGAPPPRAPLEWYFVCKIGPDRFEVQRCNDIGESLVEGTIGPEDTTLTLAGDPVPAPVLAAAKERKEGSGEYVDAEGRIRDLWGNLRPESPQAA